MLGSAALREQAMMRDREAQNFQAQSKELAEAERLEQQAREHRERAVAQGEQHRRGITEKSFADLRSLRCRAAVKVRTP